MDSYLNKVFSVIFRRATVSRIYCVFSPPGSVSIKLDDMPLKFVEDANKSGSILRHLLECYGFHVVHHDLMVLFALQHR